MASLFDRMKKIATETAGDVASAVVNAAGDAVSKVVPKEIVGLTFDLKSVADVILLADRKNLLNDPKTASLKNAATRIKAGEELSTGDLVTILPDLLELELTQKAVTFPPELVTALRAAAKMTKIGESVLRGQTRTGDAAPEARPEPTPQGEPVVEGAQSAGATPKPRRSSTRKVSTASTAKKPGSPTTSKGRAAGTARRQAPRQPQRGKDGVE